MGVVAPPNAGGAERAAEGGGCDWWTLRGVGGGESPGQWNDCSESPTSCCHGCHCWSPTDGLMEAVPQKVGGSKGVLGWAEPRCKGAELLSLLSSSSESRQMTTGREP